MQNEQVRTLSSRLRQVETEFPDYWTFDGRDRRVGAHAIFHYPAMMVPQMQGAILDLIREVAPHARTIFDPFVGSGTTLVEAMARGLNFSGVDINPLAVLLSKVKATVLPPEKLKQAATRIAARISADKQTSYFVQFHNQQKWFSKSASIALSRIARGISCEADLATRRVFWVVLARIVRAVCNSRSSTYKLHIKAPEDAIAASVDPLLEFNSQSTYVLECLDTHYRTLRAAGALDSHGYTGKIDLSVGNILENKAPPDKQADIVITSPPYGDNRTTIPYGQYSYLPLRWIPLSDIAPEIDHAIISSTHATDTASLGGSMQGALARGAESCARYSAYQATMEALRDKEEGQKRFASFAADLKRSVQVLAQRTRPGGFHVWTVGERRIGGVRVPMAQLLEEILLSENISLIHAASRRILSKRMASRNTTSETMDAEQVLIARRS